MTGWTPPALPAQWTWTADLPPWVGRRREREQLELYWTAVEHHARQLVLITGEPGAGKSRLVMETSLALGSRGVPVLVGQCTSDLGLPFDPLVAPVRGLLRAVVDGELEIADSQAVTAAEVSQLLSVLTSGAAPEVAPTSLAVVALGAVVSALASACSLGPVVMVLEDLHWAGESGLRGLRHLVERTADLPLLILATYRDTQPDVTDALTTMTSELVAWSGVHRIDLGGLATPEVSSYLTALDAADPQTVARAAGLLRERTGGNPFLLGEVCRELRDRGGLEQVAAGHLAVPGSLQAMIRSRLGRLPHSERSAVGRGAVVGEVFDVELVHAAGDQQSESLEDVYQGLAAAAAAGLIKAVPDRFGTYCFPHALARQAVLEEMDAYTVATTHAAVGRALERGRDLREPSRLLQLAHHYAMAVGLGLEDQAAHYLEESAQIATARLANSDGAALFERAAGLVAGARERGRLLLRAAASYVRAGQLERGRALSDAVATSGDPDQRLEAALVYEGVCWRIGVGASRAMELLQQAIEDFPMDEVDPKRLLASACHGRELVVVGRFAEGEEELERTLAVARGTDDRRLLLAVLTKSLTPSANVWGPRDVDWLRRQRDHAAETWRLAKAEGELDALGSAAELRAFAAYILGNADELDLALGDLRQVARTTHDPFWLWRHSLMAGSKHLLNCEFTAAAESLAATRRMGASFGYRWEDMDGPWSLQSFVLRRETGALEFARAALATISPPSAWAPGLVAIHCELEMAREAREALRRTLEQGLDRLRDSVTWPASFSLLAEAAVWLADRSAAEALIADAGDFSGLNLMGAEFLAPFGSADRLLAGLKGVLGRRGVEDDFAAALELDARMHSPLHVATTQAEWAAWLRRSGARESRIEEHSAPARQLADRYGLARVRRVLGADAAGGPASRPAGLTGREREVLQLIGRGRSNREIADELFISEHTAANHVRSILMKTQTANRTAAAHYARQHGLLRDDSDDRHP